MKRLLVLLAKTGYRAADFLDAAEALGAETVVASDRCHVLDAQDSAPQTRESVVYDPRSPSEAAQTIAEYARVRPVDAVVATDDATAVLAARVNALLGLPHNDLEGADATRDKLAARRRLSAAGLAQPGFREISVLVDSAAAAIHESPGFPCVVKPRGLSASRGVIRADDPPSFDAALARIRALLAEPEVRARSGALADSVIVERYLPGREAALEGLVTDGEVEVLALFDKPDPLVGPYFEETLYITPSRMSDAAQANTVRAAADACRALGIRHGPIHAEVRIDDDDQAWVLECAARSIGGLCSRTLRFSTGQSLEALVIAHALGLPVDPRRDQRASGVLMIPIPLSGVLKAVGGLEDAGNIEGVEDIVITARIGRSIRKLPEGDAYLGFAFATGDTPEAVEGILREVHETLQVEITPGLGIVTPAT
jgi:biotin carboxylase